MTKITIINCIIAAVCVSFLILKSKTVCYLDCKNLIFNKNYKNLKNFIIIFIIIYNIYV